MIHTQDSKLLQRLVVYEYIQSQISKVESLESSSHEFAAVSDDSGNKQYANRCRVHLAASLLYAAR